MPLHDWSRVDAGVFHSFHNTWIGELTKALNFGLLPPDYYALGKQIAGSLGPDVLTLQTPTAQDQYALKRRTVVIRHVSKHRIVALIEILSPDNKDSRHAVRSFLDKAVSALAHGIHLLLLDLHPPGPRDPQGMHALLWERLSDAAPAPPADKPLTLAAYVAGAVATAYVEPLAVGDTVPDMPLFLDPEQYVNVPLEATYRAAYEGVPRYYRQIQEAPAR
jgi:hypothetical protein